MDLEKKSNQESCENIKDDIEEILLSTKKYYQYYEDMEIEDRLKIMRSIEKVMRLHKEKKNDFINISQIGFKKASDYNYFVVQYPPRSTAPEFGEDERYLFENKIETLLDGVEKGGLYIHYPVCTRRCLFCHFNIIASSQSEKTGEITKQWKESVLHNINYWSQKSKLKEANLFFGGGTPSLIEIAMIGEIIQNVREKMNIKELSEVTLEIHPEVVKQKGYNLNKWLRGIKEAGVNRISIGQQSYSNEILRQSAREHTAEEGRTIYNEAREVFENINIDLMWGGLRGEKVKDFVCSMVEALKLHPASITTYEVWSKPDTFDYYLQNKKSFKQQYPTSNDITVMALLRFALAEEYDYRNIRSDWFVPKEEKIDVQYQETKWTGNKKQKDNPLVTLPLGPGSYAIIIKGDNGVEWFTKYIGGKDEYIDFTKNHSGIELLFDRGVELLPEEVVRFRTIMDAKHSVCDHFVLNIHELKEVGVFGEFNNVINGLYEIKLVNIESSENEIKVIFTEIGRIFKDEIAALFSSNEILIKSSNTEDSKEKRYDWFPNSQKTLAIKNKLIQRYNQ